MAAEFDPYYEWFGIPPKDQPPNLYRLLGIELFEENRRVIDTAANRQMSFIKEYQAGEHSELTQRILNELSTARLRLLNKETKAAYDKDLRDALKTKEARRRPPPLAHARSVDETTEDAAVPTERKEVVPLRVPMTPPNPLQQAGTSPMLPFVGVGQSSPNVALIILGSISGLLIGYCVLLFGFRSGFLDMLSSREPREPRETAREPAESPTTDAKSTTRSESQAARRDDEPASSPLGFGAGVAEDQRDDGLAAAVQATSDPQTPPVPSSFVESFAELAEGVTDKAQPSDPSASELTRAKVKSSVTEPAPTSEHSTVVKLGDIAAEPGARQRSSAPDPQAQIASQTLAREMYADSFREAETVADKIALGKRMIEAARQVPDGSSDQYVLLTIATDVVAGTGDAETALLAIDRLAERFDVDAVAMRSETLLAAAAHATSAVQGKAVAASALAVIEDLSKERRYELALDVCEAAEGAAAKTKESALIRKLADTKANLHQRRERFERYQQALAVLENDSEDPAANHAAGSYLCFVEDDWERGVAMLALGGNVPEFQGVAVMEQRQARSPEEQVAVGDAWWTLAETHEGPDRDALRRRAEFWYRKAAPDLPEGLAKLKIDQRLEVLSQLGSSTTTPSGTVDSARRELTGEKADQVAQLIVEAQESLDRQDQIEARRKLLQINQLDDGNPQACFYLGLLAALVERNGSDARKYFIRAQRSGLEDVACLNNLALTAVRMRDVSQAVSHWRKAIELGSAPEVSHNLGVLFRLADRKRVNVPVGIRETLAQYQNAARASGGDTWEHRGSLRGNGWWYMDFMGESAGPEDWRWPNLSDRTCMQCNGMGTADCPVSACSRGRVRQSTVDTIPLPGGHVVKKQRIIPVACSTCRGTGRIPCPFCRNGTDGDL